MLKLPLSYFIRFVICRAWVCTIFCMYDVCMLETFGSVCNCTRGTSYCYHSLFRLSVRSHVLVNYIQQCIDYGYSRAGVG